MKSSPAIPGDMGDEMKRDMDLVRKIAIAAADMGPNLQLDRLDGVDAHVFAEHVRLMSEAGLIEAYIAGGYPDPIALVTRLTWEGNDFVDASRDEALWRRALAKVAKAGASFTFDVLKEALKAEIAQGFSTLRGGT